jgi:hypothetical protein
LKLQAATSRHEAWIADDAFRGGFRVVLTGPHGLERTVSFAINEEPGVITAHIRAAPDD